MRQQIPFPRYSEEYPRLAAGTPPEVVRVAAIYGSADFLGELVEEIVVAARARVPRWMELCGGRGGCAVDVRFRAGVTPIVWPEDGARIFFVHGYPSPARRA